MLPILDARFSPLAVSSCIGPVEFMQHVFLLGAVCLGVCERSTGSENWCHVGASSSVCDFFILFYFLHFISFTKAATWQIAKILIQEKITKMLWVLKHIYIYCWNEDERIQVASRRLQFPWNFKIMFQIELILKSCLPLQAFLLACLGSSHTDADIWHLQKWKIETKVNTKSLQAAETRCFFQWGKNKKRHMTKQLPSCALECSLSSGWVDSLFRGDAVRPRLVFFVHI